MKRTLEHFYIWEKENLKLRETCQAMRETLVAYLQNNEYVLKELSNYFIDAAPPLPIQVNDPTQIVTLKKIINALHHAENAFQQFESINLERDQTVFGKLESTKSAVVSLYRLAQEASTAVELINSTSSDVATILAPHLNVLVLQLTHSYNLLSQYSPHTGLQKGGTLVADGVNMLPAMAASGNDGFTSLSNVLTQLPSFFEGLQDIISAESFTVPNKANVSANEHQQIILEQAAEKLRQRAKKIADNFANITTSSAVGAIPSYISTVSALIELSKDLVGTGAPLTKESYRKAEQKLNLIRHEYLPRLVIELEVLEEDLCLQPGVLTEPLLEVGGKYYAQLAALVNGVAMASGVMDTFGEKINSWYFKLANILFTANSSSVEIGEKLKSDESLAILRDDEFVNILQQARLQRLAEQEFNATNKSKLIAADNFFATLKTFGLAYKTSCKWNLVNLKAEEKSALLVDYAQFQTEFAALHPEIDQLIMCALTTEDKEKSKDTHWDNIKLLWSADHFKKVLACEASVTNAIQQSQAQAAFKVKVIKEAESYRADFLYAAQNGQTILSNTVQPFQALPYTFEHGQSAKFYEEKVVTYGAQFLGLELAENAMQSFFSLLDVNYPHQNPKLSDLSEAEKEVLRFHYKKFQAHVVLVDATLNNRLVTALQAEHANDDTNNSAQSKISNSGQTTTENLAILDLANLKATLTNHLDSVKQETINCGRVSNDLLNSTNENAPLLLSSTASRTTGTLVGQIHRLQLSKKVEHFITARVQPFLEKNLDPTLVKALQLEAGAKVPHVTTLYNSTPVEITYKRLLNSLYSLQNGLERLEQIDSPGSWAGINRVIFLYKFLMPLLTDFIQAKNELGEVAFNPALHEIVQESLALLEPLYAIPIIGNYLKSTVHVPVTVTAPVDELDIVAAWKAQQEVVKVRLKREQFEVEDLNAGALEEVEVLAEAEDEDIFEDASEYAAEDITEDTPVDSLLHFTNLMYQIPAEMQKFNSNYSPEASSSAEELRAKGLALVQKLTSFSNHIGTEASRNFLTALNSLSIQISMIGYEGRTLLVDQLRELRSQGGAEIIAVFDTAEFELGLKPGTLTEKAVEFFDDFYVALVSHLSLTTKTGEAQADQNALKILLESSMVSIRRQKETARLNKVILSSEAKEVGALMFTQTNPEFKVIDALYGKIAQLEDKLLSLFDDGNTKPIEVVWPELQVELVALYHELAPHFPAIMEAEKCTLEEIQHAESAGDLALALDKLMNMQREVTPEPEASIGIFEKLNELYLLEDFADDEINNNEELKVIFLNLYQALQPYLFTIDNNFDLNLYLRELQTAADFESSLKKILDLKPKLLELIDVRARMRTQQIDFCTNRLQYFAALEEKERIESVKRVNQFALKVLNNYLDANVQSRFDENLGVYAAAFFKNVVKPHFNQATLVENITLEDDIERVIAARGDQRLQEIVSDPLFKITLGQKCKQANEKFKRIQRAFFAAENAQKRYEAKASIDPQISKVDDNLCRVEKHALLAKTYTRFANEIANFSEESFSEETLDKQLSDADEVLNSLADYDEMISIYDCIEEMKIYIFQQTDSDSDINQEKLNQLLGLQAMLVGDAGIEAMEKYVLGKEPGFKYLSMELLSSLHSRNGSAHESAKATPAERLQKVKAMGLNEAFQQTLTKNSDNMLTKLLKSLLSLIGWKSKEEKNIVHLAEQLSQLRDAAVASPEIIAPEEVVIPAVIVDEKEVAQVEEADENQENVPPKNEAQGNQDPDKAMKPEEDIESDEEERAGPKM